MSLEAFLSWQAQKIRFWRKIEDASPYEMRHYQRFSILKLVNETIYKLSRF